MAAKTKLELTWIGKDKRPRLEPRLLLEDERYSYHAKVRRDGDQFDNMLIKGDNLLALKALEQNYAGQVKCIFIDPPYNTGSAFEHYDDGLEHSIWLGMMRDRLEIIRNLMSDDGSLWMTIDDNEGPYLRILADEIFGRSNFVATVVWQKIYARDNRATISTSQDYIHVYAKNAADWKLVRNRLPRDEDQLRAYKNPDNDPRGLWKAADATAQAGHGTASQFYEITLPSGEVISPPAGRAWLYTRPRYEEMLADGRIWFGANGRGRPAIKRFISEVQDGVVPTTWWPYNEVGHNQDAKKEILALFPNMEPFATPKPEKLLQRILEISTNPGDLVLDSFAGSGTTGAVAHKMGRRWIMVELGDHCETYIVPRLKKVIDGEDPGGVTEAIGWKAGGGYRYYKLAPSLLEKDQFDNWVISKSYNAEMLAEAMCNHFSFTYRPSIEHYWMHGHSSESDFIYVTTNSLTHEQLVAISDEVGPGRTLLICCKAFQGGNADAFSNLTIRKIPGAILDRCEWGKDDYSLKIEALPLIEDEPEETADAAQPRKSSGNPNQPGLFNGDEEVEA